MCSLCSYLHLAGEWKGLFFYFCNHSRAYSNEIHLEPPSTFIFTQRPISYTPSTALFHTSLIISVSASPGTKQTCIWRTQSCDVCSCSALLWCLKAFLWKHFTIQKSELFSVQKTALSLLVDPEFPSCAQECNKRTRTKRSTRKII